MKPAFPYYGGKTRLAPWIVSHLPGHRTYCEPFAGSAAVLFAKSPSPFEVLNDIDQNVITFFRVLREDPEELQRLCQLSPYSRDEYNAADLRAEDLSDLERARRFFVTTTQSFNAVGTAAARSSWAPSIRQGGSKAHVIRRLSDRLHDVADRLRPVTLEAVGFETVIPRFDSDDTTFYVDPPYLDSTRSSLYGSGGKRARDYQHELCTDEGHRRLAEVLHTCAGAVVLSGYRSDLYADLYADWDTVEVAVHRSTANRRGVKAQRGTEVLWSNRPLTSQGELGIEAA